jgi:hypothetical protein
MADAVLGSLGSDVAFAVSFSIAGELLDAATDASVAEDELIALVLALAVVLGALPKGAKSLVGELRERRWLGLAPKPPPTEGAPPPVEGGLTHFAEVLLSIGQRIATSTAIQLLARGVSTQHPFRAARVVSLLSVALFFLFLDASSSVAMARK